MPRHIVKLEGCYFEYSTFVDAPVTEPMSLADFSAYYRDKYGSVGIEDLPTRIARADSNGTSSHNGETAESLLAFNRAGENEACLSLDELRAWARGEDAKKASAQ